MDVLSLAVEYLTNFIRQLPDPTFSFLLRINLLLIGPIIAAYIGFTHCGIRNQKAQVAIMCLGAAIGLNIPLYRFMGLTHARSILFVPLLLGCFYLPNMLAYLAHPYIGAQSKITMYARYIIAALFLLNLFICA